MAQQSTIGSRQARRVVRRRRHGRLRQSDFFVLGFGSMIGVGWAVSSNHWLAQAGGPIPAFLGFVIGSLLLIPIGLSHGELMSALPVGGGVMAYAQRAFGRGLSFISSWFLALAYLAILPWESIYINRILANLWPVLRSGPILYQSGGRPIYATAVGLGLVFAVILLLINLRGSKLAAKLQSFLALAIVAVGLLIIVIGFINGRSANLLPLYRNIGVGSHDRLVAGILSMVSIVPFFMAGFDAIPQAIEEAHPRLPTRRIARTLISSIALAGVFYALIILSTASLSPWEDFAVADAPAVAPLLETLYAGVLGRLLYTLVMFGTLAGLLTTWNGMFLAAARLLQAMARAELLPRGLARAHPRYGTPSRAALVCFVAAALGPFVGLTFIDPLTSLGSVSFVLGWFCTCLSAVALRHREPGLERSYRPAGGMAMLYAALAISAAIALLSFIPPGGVHGARALWLFVAWLVLGAPSTSSRRAAGVGTAPPTRASTPASASSLAASRASVTRPACYYGCEAATQREAARTYGRGIRP